MIERREEHGCQGPAEGQRTNDDDDYNDGKEPRVQYKHVRCSEVPPWVTMVPRYCKYKTWTLIAVVFQFTNKYFTSPAAVL